MVTVFWRSEGVAVPEALKDILIQGLQLANSALHKYQQHCFKEASGQKYDLLLNKSFLTLRMISCLKIHDLTFGLLETQVVP